MPICPGCERNVSYDNLDEHERVCPAIWADQGTQTQAMDRIEARLVALERKVDTYFGSREPTLAAKVKDARPFEEAIPRSRLSE